MVNFDVTRIWQNISTSSNFGCEIHVKKVRHKSIVCKQWPCVFRPRYIKYKFVTRWTAGCEVVRSHRSVREPVSGADVTHSFYVRDPARFYLIWYTDSLNPSISFHFPGGKIYISTRHINITGDPHMSVHLEPAMKSHEDNGNWKWLKREIVPGYLGDWDGFVVVFEVL